MFNNEQDCLDELLKRSEAKGFLTYEEIENLEDSFNVSISGADRIINAIILRGVLIYEKLPETREDKDVIDYSQTDYDEIFDEALALSKEYAPLIRTIKTYAPPQWNEVKRLSAQIRQGNSFARDRLIKCYLRNAIKIALSITKRYHLDVDDAISSSIIGLIRSMDRHVADNSSTPILSYISFGIINRIQNSCRPAGVDLYLPPYVLSKITSVIDLFIHHGCEHCCRSEICPKLLEEVEASLDIPYDEASSRLELLTSFYRNNLSLSDLYEHDEKLFWNKLSYIEEYGFEIDSPLIKEVLNEAINLLPERERQIISLRFGINVIDSFTLDAVAKHFNVTRERIRQIEKRSLGILQRILARSRIARYLEEEYGNKQVTVDNVVFPFSASVKIQQTYRNDTIQNEVFSLPNSDNNGKESTNPCKSSVDKRLLSLKNFDRCKKGFYSWLKIRQNSSISRSIYWQNLKRVVVKAAASGLIASSFNIDDLKRIETDFFSIPIFQKHVFSSRTTSLAALGLFIEYLDSDAFGRSMSDVASKKSEKRHNVKKLESSSSSFEGDVARFKKEFALSCPESERCKCFDSYEEDFYLWLRKRDCSKKVAAVFLTCIKSVLNEALKRKIINNSFARKDLEFVEKVFFLDSHSQSLGIIPHSYADCFTAFQHFAEFLYDDYFENASFNRGLEEKTNKRLVKKKADV